MYASNPVIDKAFNFIISTICALFEGIVKLFLSNNLIAIIIFILLVNVIAILLIKKDKEYAQTPGAKRVRENTLLIVAAVGGAIGEYYAMYKYKHKTLHKKFTLGVPIIMMIQFSMLAYSIFYEIIV